MVEMRSVIRVTQVRRVARMKRVTTARTKAALGIIAIHISLVADTKETYK